MWHHPQVELQKRKCRYFHTKLRTQDADRICPQGSQMRTIMSIFTATSTIRQESNYISRGRITSSHR